VHVSIDWHRQTPVHNQRVAILAKHNIFRLEVAVQDASVVCVSNCLADRHQTIQKTAKFDGLGYPNSECDFLVADFGNSSVLWTFAICSSSVSPWMKRMA